MTLALFWAKRTRRYYQDQLEWVLLKSQKITNVDEDIEKRKCLCTTCENINYSTNYAKEDGELKKKKPSKSRTSLKTRTLKLVFIKRK
jgi:hypothetical protein